MQAMKGTLTAAKKIKVLIIDDDKDLCFLIKKHLQSGGNYNVIIAKEGDMGIWLASCRWHKPDVILLDIMMPGIDGIEVLRQLRSNKKTAYTPIIMLTARADMATRIKAEGFYCTDYLVKPVDIKALKSAIDRLLDRLGKAG